MEFKFRAGEDRPPSYLAPSIADAYLPAQAPRAGYFGANLQRHDPWQNPMMTPINPMMTPLNPAMMIPTREAVRREMEKERIREEIITEEILRKRMLEEEVRMELAYERDVALRRQAEQFSLQGMKHKMKAKQDEVLIASGKPGGGNKIEATVEAAASLNPNKLKKEWSCDLCNVRATSEQDLKNGHLQGRKHKAKAKERELLIASETGEGKNIEAKQFVIPEKVEMEWSCDLCSVTAPSEQGLNEHLYGKQHKAKEEELLIASKCDEGNKIEATELINPNKVKKEWYCSLCRVSPPNEEHLNKHLQGKKHKAKEEELLIASKCDGGNKIEATEFINPNKVKKEWYCSLCRVSPPNEEHLNKHLQGKKHKAKEEELLIASKCDEGNKIEATELINPNKVKKEWYCSLCRVSPPNEEHLNKHLQGKMHKAKEEELLIASKCDEGNKIEATEFINSNKVKKEWYCALCRVSPPNKEHLNKHFQGKKHKANEEKLIKASNPASSSTTSKKGDNSNTLEKQGVTSNCQQKKLQQLVPNEAKKIVGKQSLLHYCEHCKLQCNSASMLASHLSGKKHLSRLQTLNAPLTKVNESNKLVDEVMTTSSTKGFKKPQVGQSNQRQQVPKKQSKAVKNRLIHCEHCKVDSYGELMLESHLRGKKHLTRMQELESHKGVTANHNGDANAGVTYGRNEESEADVNKVAEIVEVKQSIGNRQDEQDLELERTSIGNHQDEQVVASDTMDGVPVPSTEQMADRTDQEGAQKNFSLGNLTRAVVRFLFTFSVAGY